MYREKKNIIADIFEMVKDENFYVPFVHNNSFTIHYKGLTYDVMAISVDEWEDLIVECVPHYSFKLDYLNLDKLCIRTINSIYNHLVKLIDEL